MKIKKYFFALLASLCFVSLAACGNSESKPLKVFVGTESLTYYQSVLNQYVEDNNLPFTIEVSGGDTGGYADVFTRDTAKGADIFVTAHDNFAKLLAGSGTISPITKQSLINNMEETVDSAFLDVCYVSAGGAQPKYYGVPIIRQALVLYYNKALFSGENASKVNSWEGIVEVAKSRNIQAVAYTGTDGYSYSHWLLAQPTDGSASSLELFADGNASANYAWGADQVAIHNYAIAFTANPNGRNGKVLGNSTWESQLQSGSVATVIGGAWHKNTIESAWGPEGYGVAILPTFTAGGKEYRSGSFYDVKCLVKKKGSAYDKYLDDIIEYLSSDAIQLGSYEQCGNLPASNEVELAADDQLAKAQVQQGQTAGIPQPFGYNETFNPSYYSKGTDKAFINLHEGAYSKQGTEKILQLISYTWATGNNFSLELPEATLTDWINNRNN